MNANIILRKHYELNQLPDDADFDDMDVKLSCQKIIYPAMEEYAAIVSAEKDKEIAELRRLIEKASWLVGNPGCNISSSTDLACDSWQKEWEQFKSSNNL